MGFNLFNIIKRVLGTNYKLITSLIRTALKTSMAV